MLYFISRRHHYSIYSLPVATTISHNVIGATEWRFGFLQPLLTIWRTFASHLMIARSLMPDRGCLQYCLSSSSAWRTFSLFARKLGARQHGDLAASRQFHAAQKPHDFSAWPSKSARRLDGPIYLHRRRRISRFRRAMMLGDGLAGCRLLGHRRRISPLPVRLPDASYAYNRRYE